MDMDNREEERLDERAVDVDDKSSLNVTMRDMQSFMDIAGRERNSDGMEAFGRVDIVEPREARETPPRQTEPREISEKEYKELAEEIKNTGKIPDRLKDALDQVGNGPVINLDKLNELIKDRGMKLDLIPLPGDRQRLDLIKGGTVIDSAKSGGTGHHRPQPGERDPRLPLDNKLEPKQFPPFLENKLEPKVIPPVRDYKLEPKIIPNKLEPKYHFLPHFENKMNLENKWVLDNKSYLENKIIPVDIKRR